nr:reverse transcriptase domain-containing protein [Tanacetum cinerariifolium]
MVKYVCCGREGSLPGNTVANPKGELKAITTRSGLVTDRPTIPTPLKFVTPEDDERVEKTYTDPDLAEYTIKVPPPPVKKHKPPYQRNFDLHTRDSPLSNILYPSRMLKQKLQEKDEIQIQKDPGKFLIPCGFSELKCKALANLGASINLMPLSVLKKLGLPDLIPTRMTLELANHVIFTPDGIARDVFVPIGKFTFPADFVVIDYESDPRVPLILGRPFLRTARALIDAHSEEMILRDDDERLTLNVKHDTTNYSNHPHRESVNLINIFNVSSKDYLEFDDNPLSGNTTYSSNSLLEVFTDELALITYPPDYDDNLKFDIESDLREIEFLLYQVFCNSLVKSSSKLSRDQTSNPTPSDARIASSPPLFTPFEGGDVILEEIETFLGNGYSKKDKIKAKTDKTEHEMEKRKKSKSTKSKSTKVKVKDGAETKEMLNRPTHYPFNGPGLQVKLSNLNDNYYDTKGDILYLEKLLNEDPSPNLHPMKNEDLKQVDVTMTKSSIEEPPELKLKDLPSHLEYAFLERTNKLPVIISKELKDEEKAALLKVLKSHKRAIAWKISDIKGIDPRFCTYNILIEDDFKPMVQHQRRMNLKIHEVIKKEVIKLLDSGLIYPISDSPWVSLVHCMPKKGGMTVVENEDNELIPTRLVTGWRVCIDYQKLNDATHKDHFPLPFMDQILERLARNEYYCFLDRFLGYFQIPIDPQEQEKTTFTCPYGTFSYRRMPFGLCNAPGTFQMCTMATFHDMIEETMEVFMDNFSVFRLKRD